MADLTAAMNEILAANVKTLRQRMKLTQVEFADEMEVTQATVSRWEKGGGIEGISMARLAEMSGCSVREFTTQLLTSRPRHGDLQKAQAPAEALLLPVLLPNEDALTDMFAALLEPLRHEENGDVVARRLAQRLPVALSQTVSRSAMGQIGPPPIAPASAAEAPTKANRER